MNLRQSRQRASKSWLLRILLVLSISFFTGCSTDDVGDTLQEVQDQAENIINSRDKHVLGVKNGYPLAYPTITYGQAFDEFFAAPTWKYFKANTGDDVVEFTGRCMYEDTEVKAKLQFIFSEDGESFSQGALSFNEVPQSTLITSLMISKVFITYAEEHQISVDEYDDENVMGKGTETQIGYGDSEDDTSDESPATDEEYGDIPDVTYDESDDTAESTEYSESEDESEYIIFDSNTRRLKVREVKKLDKEICRLAKNEIYARHGRLFQDTALQEYFDSKSWYFGYVEPEDFDEHVFNKVEKANIKLLAKYEK